MILNHIKFQGIRLSMLSKQEPSVLLYYKISQVPTYLKSYAHITKEKNLKSIFFQTFKKFSAIKLQVTLLFEIQITVKYI